MFASLLRSAIRRLSKAAPTQSGDEQPLAKYKRCVVVQKILTGGRADALHPTLVTNRLTCVDSPRILSLPDNQLVSQILPTVQPLFLRRINSTSLTRAVFLSYTSVSAPNVYRKRMCIAHLVSAAVTCRRFASRPW